MEPLHAAGIRGQSTIVHPKVYELLGRQQYEQRTPAWYDIRRGLMTASDAAGALGIPAFKGQRNVRNALLEQKVSGTFTGNHMTRWGQDNEDQVRERAMQAVGEIAWEVGLVVHPELTWLGASPDGVTNTGRLIEIKCPYKRKPIPTEVPHHYWPQIQVQLECTDLDSCYFVQWQPGHLAVDGQEVFSITVVERDRAWFAENCSKLKEFWTDLMQLRATYVPPPPPPCAIDDRMYSPAADGSASTSSSSTTSLDVSQPQLHTLRQKLMDALEALDTFEKRTKKWRL
jgi:putative phage-type endonuclease